MTDKIYVDPEIEPSLKRMRERMASRPPMTSVDISVIRERAQEDFVLLNKDPLEIPLVKDVNIEGAFGTRKVRIYDAIGERDNAPGLIYFHGGGWILGDLDTEDAKLRRLALASGIRIISYNYVLAPEHKFPKPLDDCFVATKSIHENTKSLGLDPNRLAIGGASAGANLALSTAIKLRDEKRSWLRMMLLFYGTYDMVSSPPSRTLFNEGFGITTEAMDLFFSLYVGEKIERSDPMASPILADLAGLPAAFINAAGLDILRDDSRALAKKMQAVGIEVQLEDVPGVTHGFTLLAHEVSAARKIIDLAAQALRSALT
jgi:acetyl esterase